MTPPQAYKVRKSTITWRLVLPKLHHQERSFRRRGGHLALPTYVQNSHQSLLTSKQLHQTSWEHIRVSLAAGSWRKIDAFSFLRSAILIHLLLGNPSPAPDFIPTIAMITTTLSSTLCTCVPWFSPMSSSFCGTTVAKASVQKWIIYTTNYSPGSWWTNTTVILCSLLFFLMLFYVLRYLVELLVESCETLLHGFHRMGNSKLQIIYNLQSKQEYFQSQIFLF